MPDALAWYLVLQASSLVAWPLLRRAFGMSSASSSDSFRPLDAAAWASARALGPLLIAWAGWLLAMLSPLPYTRLLLVMLLLGLGGAGWWSIDRNEGLAEVRAWFRERWRSVAAVEGVFLAAFVFFLVLRSHDPSVAGTEKPMDMAFLNAFLSAGSLPTQDTWLADYGVPYYYFGYTVFATLAKLAGTRADIAFNLAAATVPALTLTLIGALAWGLARFGATRAWLAWLAAVLAGFLVVFGSNLAPAFEYLLSRGVVDRGAGAWLGIKQFGDGVVLGQWPPTGAWWWRASRVIPNVQPDGINEFPFFSALLSDLHPHFMALPFEVLVVVLACLHLASRGRSLRVRASHVAAALALGALLTLNTWDVAVFWPLYVVAVWLAGAGLPPLRRAATSLAAPTLGVVLFLPYFVGYGGPPLGIGLVEQRTPLGSFLVLFGTQAFLLAALGLVLRSRSGNRSGWVLAAGGTVAGGVLALLGEPTLGLLTALVVLLLPWPVAVEASPRTATLRLVAGWLGFAAALIWLGVEVVFLRDTFGTRMNTVFKLHYNAWLLAGLAGALGLVVVLDTRRAWRWLVVAGATVLLAGNAIYPVFATQTRLAATPPGGPTLDGLGFLSTDERAAVAWLREESAGQRPVIAEATGPQYSLAGRMATYSGAVTILGWSGHELQWRGPIPDLGRRDADLDRIYRDADVGTARALLRSYGARYVVVGDLERQRYGAGVESRFESAFPLAFRAGRVTIYRVEG